MTKLMMNSLIVSMAFLILISRTDGRCKFEAIFNFGDSNSDTGGFYSAFPSQPSPYGMTYFNRPVGRNSDGRLYIDFLAQALGLPFLSPYLQSIDSDYKHGANFATAASTALQPSGSLLAKGISPFYLAVQLHQMKHFKAKVEQLHSAAGGRGLPKPDIFGKSLYTFYIGHNDFASHLATLGVQGLKQYLPQVASQISSSIKEVYALGGRTFLVLNLGPFGCYPSFLAAHPHESSDIDAFGCVISYNIVVQDYNRMLKETLSRTRQELVDSKVVYVDSHSVLLDMFQHPESHGMRYGTRACCGYGGGAYNYNPQVSCGLSKVRNGQKISATACNDPQNYVSWDGIHATEAANKILAVAVLNGSSSDPPFPFQQFCHIQSVA